MADQTEETLPGTLESLGPLREVIAEHARAAGLGEKAIYDLCLAVDEIATNVVLHGYQEAGRTGPLRVVTTLDPERFTVTLEDEGVPFDPTRYVIPTLEELRRPLDERPVGGLGILLAIRGVHEIRYRSEHGVNRTIFVVKRA